MSDTTWRPCSNCGKPIACGAIYYVCSVSTCNTKKRPLRFCTVDCWDAHLPDANHRSAWAVEETAPSVEEAAAEDRATRAAAARARVDDRGAGTGTAGSSSGGDDGPIIRRLPPAGPKGQRGGGSGRAGSSRSAPARRTTSRRAPAAAVPVDDGIDPLTDVLVVVSRMKDYIRARSGGFSTADAVSSALSDHVRRWCDEAIREAELDGRETVMERDLDQVFRRRRP